MIRFIFVIILFCSSLCYAELYYWTDENGVKHISDSKPDTDAEDLKTIKEYKSSSIEKTDSVATPPAIRTKPPVSQQSRKKAAYRQTQNVVMYSTQKCGYCRKAKSFFKKNSIRYTDYDVGASEEALKKYKSLNGKGVPLIYIGDQRISGFNEPALKRALDLK